MDQQTPPRECRPCTACCDGWLEINVEGARAKLGSPCPHSTGAGCNNYAHRPVNPCVTFRCGGRKEGSPYPDWMKPSESKVIVLFNQRTWQGMPVDVGVPVGASIPPQTLEWLKRFAEINHRPLLWSEQIMRDGAYTGQQRVAMHGPPAFQQEMAERIRMGEKLW